MISLSGKLFRFATRLFLFVALTVTTLTAIYYPRDTDYVMPAASSPAIDERQQAFYDHSYAADGESVDSEIESSYGVQDEPAEAKARGMRWQEVFDFVEEYDLHDKRVLEVGAGAGTLQDIVDNYIGLDLSNTVRRFFHKPFVQGSATALPFHDGAFDVVWTVTVIEHVPEPEIALREMRRVLKNGGILFLNPAWQCRSWAADGYAVRPYGDLSFGGKMIKASIPFRDSVIFRSLYTFPIRMIRLLQASLSGGPTQFRYNALTPNYTKHWTSDGDATASMDPYEAILWFKSRGDEILNYEGVANELLVRTGAVIIRVRKDH